MAKKKNILVKDPETGKDIILDVEDLSWIKAGRRRIQTIEYIANGHKTPRDVARATGMSTTHASKIVKAMEGRGIVECLNPDAKRGKIYRLTRKGRNLRRNL